MTPVKTKIDFELQGKTALVTGSSRGLGFAIAKAYAEHGANVILVARSKDQLLQGKDIISSLGVKVWSYPLDLADLSAIDDFFTAVIKKTGGIDILANVAGCTARHAAVDFPIADWQRVMDVNVTATFILSQNFARHCIAEQKAGKIINIASLLSEAARPTIPAYTASKGAIKQLTRALAVEWAPHNIQVNAIGPGYFKTEMTQPLYDNTEFNEWVIAKTPAKRWGDPVDLTGAAVFLASSAADFITGQVIYVDGGWLANL